MAKKPFNFADLKKKGKSEKMSKDMKMPMKGMKSSKSKKAC